MNNKPLIITLVIVIFILGGLFYIYNPEPVEIGNNEEENVVCTMDALLCPDGSYVGRVPPDCQFEACPIPDDAVMEDGVILDDNN